MTGSFFDAVIALTVTFKTLFDEQRFFPDDTPPENDESQYCILRCMYCDSVYYIYLQSIFYVVITCSGVLPQATVWTKLFNSLLILLEITNNKITIVFY